jgi:biotin carboxyl carrier protein
MAEVNGTGPAELLGPADRHVRAALDPASALDGDEHLVVATDDPATGNIRRVDARHAVVEPDARSGREPAHVLLGPVTRDGAGARHREVVVDGWRFVVVTQPERLARLRARATSGREAAVGSGRIELRAVIPGRVVAVSVASGDTVEAGQQLLIVEAMKMQNEVRAPHAGSIERIDVGPGDTVELGALLLVIA